MFTMRKPVWQTLFKEGFAIDQRFQDEIQNATGGPLTLGERRPITLIIYGQMFQAALVRLNIARAHSPIIQIRYDGNKNIAALLKTIFFSTWNHVQKEKIERQNTYHKQQLKLPGDDEYFDLTCMGNALFEMECHPCSRSGDLLLDRNAEISAEQPLTVAEHINLRNEISQMAEIDFELIDHDTDYTVSDTLQHVRHLNRKIGDKLKKIYDYRCQVTGEKVGESYNGEVVEVHHIIPFTKSLNNNSSNLIILSPNFHRIIHQTHPVFDRDNLEFVFQNGVREKVRLDKHLKYIN